MKPALHTPGNPSVTADTPKVTAAQLDRALARLRTFPDPTSAMPLAQNHEDHAPAFALAQIDHDARAQQAAGHDLPLFTLP
jgi:hypothetical protein